MALVIGEEIKKKGNNKHLRYFVVEGIMTPKRGGELGNLKF